MPPTTPATPAEPILVNGGLVETRDSTLQGPGELAVATDAYYKVNDPGIWSVPGRRQANTVVETTPIIGGQFAPFDSHGGTVDGTDFVIIRTNSAIRYAAVAPTMTFADLVTGLPTAATFDACHYSNQWTMFDGVSRNRVLIPGTNGVPQVRFQGMLQNVSAPTYSNTGVGTGFTLSNGNTIVYWVEERVRDAVTNNLLRQSGNAGSSTTVTVTGTGALIKPVITRPAIVNSDATHWALFAAATNDVFPFGALISEVPIATASIEDTRTTNDPLIPSGALYDTVTVSLYGITQTFGKHGPPPIATSMDVQEDSLVANDISDHSLVRFSYPNDIDSWPYSHVIRFETKEGNEVQWVRYLGQSTIVALTDEVWRINTLPATTDAGFQVNRVKTQIEGAHGGSGPQTSAVFSFGQGPLLAYISPSGGLMVTDGEFWDTLAPDFNFAGRVDASQIPTSILINNPTEFRLEYTYTPLGGAHNSATAFFHYHQSQAKITAIGFATTRRTKVTAPINRDALCKFLVAVGGVKTIFSGTTNGKVYQEWTGPTNPDGDIAYAVFTGDKFPSGVGRQARARRIYVHHQAGGAGNRATFVGVQKVEGMNDTTETRSFPVSRREHTSIYADLQGESIQLGVTATNPPQQISIDFFIASFEDQGEATPAGET